MRSNQVQQSKQAKTAVERKQTYHHPHHTTVNVLPTILTSPNPLIPIPIQPPHTPYALDLLPPEPLITRINTVVHEVVNRIPCIPIAGITLFLGPGWAPICRSGFLCGVVDVVAGSVAGVAYAALAWWLKKRMRGHGSVKPLPFSKTEEAGQVTSYPRLGPYLQKCAASPSNARFRGRLSYRCCSRQACQKAWYAH
jgi:hypothetical protein